MSNFFKATVRKLSELPWEDFARLFTWPSGGSVPNVENPNLLIAKATKNGEVVAYVAAEPILLVDSFTFNPASDASDTPLAGDAIDNVLAQHAGVQRMWIVVPNDAPPMKDEKFIRVLERRVVKHQPPISDECNHTATPSHVYLN